MSRLVSAVLARNEADRDLPAVLTRLREFSDAVILLDDRSTDATPKIAKGLGCEVRGRSVLKDAAWGAEAPARAELFAWGAEAAQDGWLLICDADQILVGDPRQFLDSWESNTVCFPLFDMWENDLFRADGYWKGYCLARQWMVKPSFVPEGWTPQWSGRRMHAGHLPSNWPQLNPIVTDLIYWRHLAYSSPERRARKYEQYLSQKENLSPEELSHAMSIADV